VCRKEVLHYLTVLTESAVRDLAQRWISPVVTSFYLDVDGSRYPRPSDYAPHVERLFRLARGSAVAEGGDAVDAIEADLSRIAGWLERDLERGSTRGVAAFSCGALGLFEVFALPTSVRDQVVVGPGPDVAQLCAVLYAGEQILAVAVDRQRCRMLRLEHGEIEEREAPIDAIERQVDTDVEVGSFERRHEELARQHYRHVASAVGAELERRPATSVVLFGPEDSVSRLEGYLPEHAMALVRGKLRLPVASERVECARAASEVVRGAKVQRQRELIVELRERSAESAAAVTGLGPALEALGTGRVGTLLVEDGYGSPGGRCPACGQLVPDSVPCTRCGATPIGVENVVDAAVTEAFTHRVEIEFCDASDLAGLGHIGAMDRW
jgi:peptide chain release factor subunit 1